MEDPHSFTAFTGERLLATGSRVDVALAAKSALESGYTSTILIFDDQTGGQVDFDLRGTDEEIVDRLGTGPDQPGDTRRPSGRPKLGVVAREVTLLPRHWEWLSAQPGGASVTLRKLVEAARSAETAKGAPRQAQQAADRFMSAMLGDQPGYEEASRALYAGDRARFLSLSKRWPADLRDHARKLADPALPNNSCEAEA